MGLEFFLSMVTTAPRDKYRTAEELSSAYETTRSLLLQKPNIVVVDEAHSIKNLGTQIRSTVSKFSTTRRIGLTGTLLENNLLEYHSIIDWLSNGQLGTQKQFENMFMSHIEHGLYADSTTSAYQLALRKLRELNTAMGRTVHRIDRSIVESELGPKTEFLISVPLTPLQEKLYRAFVQHQVNNALVGGQTRFWNLVVLLALLCTCPKVFINRLSESTGQEEGSTGRRRGAAGQTNVLSRRQGPAGHLRQTYARLPRT